MNKVCVRIFLLTMFVLVISGAVIYFTVDINTIANLHMFQPWSVLLAILAIGVGLVLDGTRLMHMVKISGEKITLKQSVQVVFGNYFLAMLGPGAAAGAIAQVMFLQKAGVARRQCWPWCAPLCPYCFWLAACPSCFSMTRASCRGCPTM